MELDESVYLIRSKRNIQTTDGQALNENEKNEIQMKTNLDETKLLFCRTDEQIKHIGWFACVGRCLTQFHMIFTWDRSIIVII